MHSVPRACADPVNEPIPLSMRRASSIGPSRHLAHNKTERKGEVKSTNVFNKYDLLDDAETNVKAEVDEDEDEDEKGKEKGANSGKQPSVRALSTRTPCRPTFA